jgi:hypothetical protein
LILITPNLFAYAALILWPLVSLYLFATRSASTALIVTILGGYLLLPVGTEIKFPGIPALDKNSIPSFIALLGYFVISRRPPVAKNRSGLATLLVIAMIVGPFVTSEFNGDALDIGGGAILPGVGHYDALSASVGQLIVLLPFMLGWQFLRTSEDSAAILRILTVAGLAYSLPMLFEVRFSPQLHTWIYGYFPHSFEQQMRDGGFRPVVFLGHGLGVAFFGMTVILASAAIWKTKTRILPFPPTAVTAWLSGTLLLCKSLGSFFYAVALVPLILFAKPRSQIRLAVVLATIALAYPMLRTTDLVPTAFLLNAAGSVSLKREASLKVRFDQEKMLLSHSSERLWFGWGRFGRGRVYDDYGKDISVTDGHWIITMSTFGLFGFLAEFGLLALCVFRTAGVLRYTRSAEDRIFLATLVMIVAVGLVDLLPNATISPWSWLIAGALLGRTEALRNVQRAFARGSTMTRTAEMLAVGDEGRVSGRRRAD